MDPSNSYIRAKAAFEKIIFSSKTPEDPSHAENTLYWLVALEPKANDLLKLSAFAHDIERATPDRLLREQFSSYEAYKQAHSERGGNIARKIAMDSGFSREQANRISYLISSAEFSSEDDEVQLICDADSISFFDNNLPYYLDERGVDATKTKMRFMLERASPRAQKQIALVLKNNRKLNLLEINS